MQLGKRGPSSPSKRRNGRFRPVSEALEGRQLLATIDLGPLANNATETTPFGVEMVGQNNTNAKTQVVGSGYTVADLGDISKTVGGGYDAFAIGAPGLTAPSLDGNPTFTGTSTVYVVFGSNSVGTTTAVNYQSLSNLPLTQANQRAGDLGQLGTFGELTNPAYQVNPTVTQPAAPTVPFVGYNYNGLTFTTGSTPNSGLGYSIAALGDIDGSGYNSFAIGAPNAAGGGKVYVIYGSTALANLVQANTATNKVIDLDSTALATAGVKEVILEDSTVGASGQFGYSVAGLGNYFNYGPTAVKDIAIGAPGANNNNGNVYAISGLSLQGVASGATVDLANITTTSKIGIEYQGTNRTGASVGTGLDFDHFFTPSGSFEVDDLLIGAPGVVTDPTNLPSGTAYLVYGDQDLANTNGVTDSMIGTIQQLSQIGTPPPANGVNTNYPLEGVVFNNPQLQGSTLFGFSVSTAGDYNGDGTDDVIIGAPGNTGSASIYYGIPGFAANTTSVTNRTTHFTGIYPTNGQVGTTPIPPGVPPISPPLIYADSQSITPTEAGFSVSYYGDITGQGINGVAIGAPLASNGLGQVYVIPGNYQTPTTPATANFPQLVPLSGANSATNNPLYAGFALTTTQSFPATPNMPALGTSVSGRTPLIPITGANSQQYSLDMDNIPDLIVGAPGFNLGDPSTGNTTNARPLDGITYALEGSTLPMTPPNDVAVIPAGIGVNSKTGPYSIPATGALTIYLFSTAAAPNGAPAFDPSTEITSPVTLTINGVVYQNVVLTPSPSATDPGEVKFTLTAAQVAQLNLVVSTTPISFTIQGKTNVPIPVVFVGRAVNDVTVTGGGGGGGGGASLVGPTAATILTPPIFTGDLAGLPYPAVSTLSHLISYQPLPVQLAYEQFLPAPGFEAREEVYHHPTKGKTAHQAPAGTVLNVGPIGHSENKYAKYNSLIKKVFTRGKFKVGKTTTFTHKNRVIPAAEQTETYPG
jgi:FG-GAP repeat